MSDASRQRFMSESFGGPNPNKGDIVIIKKVLLIDFEKSFGVGKLYLNHGMCGIISLSQYKNKPLTVALKQHHALV